MAKHRQQEQAMPKDIAEVGFDETDIERTWDYLQKTFHLNKKGWKENFEREFKKTTRNVSKPELFVRYGKQYFQPALNTILARKPEHPTWFMLLRFMVADKIKAMRMKQAEVAKRYGRDSRYKLYNQQY